VEGLSRAEVVALSRSSSLRAEERSAIEARAGRLAPRAAWLELIHRPCGFVTAAGESLPLAALKGERVAAFCGIGNPAGFQHTLESSGLIVGELLALDDHCRYGERELARIRRWLSQQPVQHVICTRKDLVKIPHAELAGKRLLALDIELEITRGQAELEALLAPLAARLSRRNTPGSIQDSECYQDKATRAGRPSSASDIRPKSS